MKSASGEKTVTNHRQALERTMSLLQQRSRGVRTLARLERRRLWIDERVSEIAQTHYVTVLRWFWQLHGITVGTIKPYLPQRASSSPVSAFQSLRFHWLRLTAPGRAIPEVGISHACMTLAGLVLFGHLFRSGRLLRNQGPPFGRRYSQGSRFRQRR